MSSINQNKSNFIHRTLVFVGIIIAAVLIVLTVLFAHDVLFMFFAAVLLSILFSGLGGLINRLTGIPDGFASILGALLIIGAFAGGIWYITPNVAAQIGDLRRVLPEAVEKISAWLSEFSWGSLLLQQLPPLEDLFERLTTMGFLSRIGGYLTTTIGIIVTGLLIVLLAIYLAFEPQTYAHGFVKLFPKNRRERMREVVEKVGDGLRWWLIGRAISMASVGLITTIGLWYLDVPLALSLGILAGLLTFIENFGPIIAGAPAVLLALSEDPQKALYVVILYFAAQAVENYLILPIVERRAVLLPPVLTITFQLILAVLAGGLGLILATPLLVVVMISVKMLYIEDVLDDSVTVLETDDSGEKSTEQE